MMFLRLPKRLELGGKTTADLVGRAPWVRRLLDGDDVTTCVWQARLDAWDALGRA